MKFGTKTTITHTNGIMTTKIEKYHDGAVTKAEAINEERIPIIRYSDADTILEQMHIEHALTNYGVWVEKNPTSGKLYVVKCWIDPLPTDN